MNQISRQNAKNDTEKEFYKLLNNSNFGYRYRNNIDNCFLNPFAIKLRSLAMSKSTTTYSVHLFLSM